MTTVKKRKRMPNLNAPTHEVLYLHILLVCLFGFWTKGNDFEGVKIFGFRKQN